MNRRFFMQSGSVALASFGLVGMTPSFLQRVATAQVGVGAAGGRRKTLITIFQRGAVDGLNMVVPYGERRYYEYRPTLAVSPPGRGAAGESVIDLDGFFGLHPALTPLKSAWDQKRLAIVHAAGSPDNTRSHFDAQDYMEAGTPGVKSTPDGWLNRVMQASARPQASPFRAVAMAQNLPRTLMGRAPALAISNLSDFTIRAGGQSQAVQGGFEDIYEQAAGDALRGTGKDTFEAISYLKRVNPAQYRPEHEARYPQGRFGQSLLQIAQLIKAGVGLELAFADTGGWDTHTNQGNARGQLALRLTEFGQGIAALVTDLGARRMDDVIILSMSEFGRTARENGTRGTDHGHANAMFVVGGGTRGGKVYGDWPGLDPGNLHEGRDLALTTDFRDVFGEVAARHLGTADLKQIFPHYASAGAPKFRGVLG